MEDASGVKVVRAYVPLSEMFGYIGDLRSKTQGRAVVSCDLLGHPSGDAEVAADVWRDNAYTVLMQPVCVWGYASEALGRAKKWGTKK